jgi:hypothetical protein
LKANDEKSTLAESFKVMIKNIKEANEQLTRKNEGIGIKAEEAAR